MYQVWLSQLQANGNEHITGIQQFRHVDYDSGILLTLSSTSLHGVAVTCIYKLVNNWIYAVERSAGGFVLFSGSTQC